MNEFFIFPSQWLHNLNDKPRKTGFQLKTPANASTKSGMIQQLLCLNNEKVSKRIRVHNLEGFQENPIDYELRKIATCLSFSSVCRKTWKWMLQRICLLRCQHRIQCFTPMFRALRTRTSGCRGKNWIERLSWECVVRKISRWSVSNIFRYIVRF